MNPGSPLKLASEKLREGNVGRNKTRGQIEDDAAHEVDLAAITEVPKPPKHFDKEAKAEWNYVCSALIDRGVLAEGMLSVIARMCYVNAHIEKAEKLGAPPNASLLGQHRLLYESFGLTPRSVASTKTVYGKKKENKLARFTRVK